MTDSLALTTDGDYSNDVQVVRDRANGLVAIGLTDALADMLIDIMDGIDYHEVLDGTLGYDADSAQLVLRLKEDMVPALRKVLRRY